MSGSGRIELAVDRWSAWAPNVEDVASWHQWAKGERAIYGPVRPDVTAVPPLLRRRLSEVSRMAFKVALDCLDEDKPGLSYIFCSRYGEYDRSFGILLDMASGECVSPAAFSMSVHNTAASQLAIHLRDTSPSTALAAGESTLEAAFVEAWCQLREDYAQHVLIVCHDQPLPDLYDGQDTSVTQSLAVGLLVSLPRPNQATSTLCLSWTPGTAETAVPAAVAEPVLSVLSLLLDSRPVSHNAGRLTWTWTKLDAES